MASMRGEVAGTTDMSRDLAIFPLITRMVRRSLSPQKKTWHALGVEFFCPRQKFTFDNTVVASTGTLPHMLWDPTRTTTAQCRT